MTQQSRIRIVPFISIFLSVMVASYAHSNEGDRSIFTSSQTGDEDTLTFDSDFISMDKKDESKHIDLSYFAHKGGMLPGQYNVQVKVNGKIVDENRKVTFKSWPGNRGKLYACVSSKNLLSWWGINSVKVQNSSFIDHGSKSGLGVNDEINYPGEGEGEGGGVNKHFEGYNETVNKELMDCPVGGVAVMVPYGKEEFDFNNRLLSFTVPQAYLSPASRLRTPAHLWDNGITALLLNYNYNASQQSNRSGKIRSDFLSVDGQLNLLAWRIRSDLAGYSQQGRSAKWNVSEIYAQRDFSRWGGGQLTVGHTVSSGGVGDSVPFFGTKVDSDDNMLDPVFTTYTPAISGIADSPSTITARQYGKVIYQQHVPQGPYSLTDFNRLGNGDIDVEVREADGRVRHSTLAQASSGVLMSGGTGSYSASAGKATNSKGYIDDMFIQIGGSYGIFANTTLTGGVLLSRDYQSLAFGGGLYNGLLGAFNYTLQTNRSDLSAIPGESGTVMGVNHTLGWSRSFDATTIGAIYTLNQTPAAQSYSQLLSRLPRNEEVSCEISKSNRDNFGLSVSQTMGKWGSVALSAMRSTSWGSDQVQQNATLSYSTMFRDVSLGFAMGYTSQHGHDRSYWSHDKHSEHTLSLTASVPLGRTLNTTYLSNANYSYMRSGDSASQQTGLSGSAYNGALSYSVAQALTGNRSGNTSLGYAGRFGTVSGGYSYGGGASSVSYGLSGGMALHLHGVTLGQPISLTGGNALVEIPHTAGICVGGATTDWRGYALLTGLAPYDRNIVTVDMSELPGNLELDESSMSVIPTRGALVSLPFKSHRGFRLLLKLKYQGKPVVFGSSAVLKQDEHGALPISGIVGEEGEVYLSGIPEQGTVSVNWGSNPGEQCKATYTLPRGAAMDKLQAVFATCQ